MDSATNYNGENRRVIGNHFNNYNTINPMHAAGPIPVFSVLHPMSEPHSVHQPHYHSHPYAHNSNYPIHSSQMYNQEGIASNSQNSGMSHGPPSARGPSSNANQQTSIMPPTVLSPPARDRFKSFSPQLSYADHNPYQTSWCSDLAYEENDYKCYSFNEKEEQVHINNNYFQNNNSSTQGLYSVSDGDPPAFVIPPTVPLPNAPNMVHPLGVSMQMDSNKRRFRPKIDPAKVLESQSRHPDVIHHLPCEDMEDDDDEYPFFESQSENNVFHNWCFIRYNEFGQRLGPTFAGCSRHVRVDGYCVVAQPDRLSIGSIGNGNRRPGVVNVRSQVGKGITFDFDGQDCICYNLSAAPIFLQCPLRAYSLQEDISTVYRVPECKEGCSPAGLKIFSTTHFLELHDKALASGTIEALHMLHNYCIARLSFVKGFGAQYDRPTIFNTPVWIEIFRSKFLQMIDRALYNFKTTEGVSSTS